MDKRWMRLISLLLTLVMFLSVSTAGFAWGNIGIGDGWDRDIGEDEIRDFNPDAEPEENEEYDFFSNFDEETGINVVVEAPMGALPLDAEVRVEPVDVEEVREAVNSVVEGEPNILVAMDISFWLDDVEIEPEEPVRVRIAAPELEGRTDLTVVHIPDENEPETIELITDEEELKFELAGNEVCFESGDFSVYAVIDDPDPVPESRVTVNFINPHLGGEDDEANTVATVYVKNSDGDAALEQIVYDPGIGESFNTPETRNLMFRGWSIDKADANPDDGDPDTPNVYGAKYDSNTKVYTVEDIRTYLKNMEITEGDVVNIYAMIFQKATIKYIGDNEDLSLGTFAVLRSLNEESAPYTVSMAYTPGPEQNFEGWMIMDASQADNIVSATYNGTVIPKPYNPVDAENPTVFPNDTVLQVKGDVTLTVSTPTGHWLIFDENGHGATYNAPMFVKGGKLTACPELAKPENMKRVGYTFGGWYKDAACTNGNEFRFGYELEANTTIYAKWTEVTSGNYTVIIWTQNLSATGYDYQEGIVLSGTPGTTINTVTSAGTGDNRYARVNGVNKQYTGFHLDTYDTNVTINPEGNAIVNVYYNRNSYTLTFRRYENSGTVYKTITALYQQPIGGNFPISVNGDETYRWEPHNSSTFNQVLVYIDVMPAENITFTRDSSSAGTKYMELYVEALPGQTADRTWNGKNFVKHGKTIPAKYNFFTEAEDFLSLNGFDKYGSDPAFSNGRAYVNNGGTIRFYYTRKLYTITYMDGIYVDGYGNPINEPNRGQLDQRTNIQYMADISSFNKGGGDYYEPTYNGFVFAGWYLDKACTAPCTFNTMPQDGVTVYAKWVQVQFRVFLHPMVPESDNSLNWGAENVEMTRLVSNGDKISLPKDGKRLDYEFVGWFLDPEYSNVFNADLIALTTGYVKTPYDKTVDMTTPMNKYGLGATENEDLELFWVNNKLDLYGKWKAKIDGALGIGIIYDVGEGSGDITDPNLYEDNTKAVAQEACTPPAAGEDGRNFQFLYWVVQKWENGAFVDTDVKVFPGDNFWVYMVNSRVEDISNPTDPNVTKTYTIQLRAEFGPVDAPVPTYITWYSNVYDCNGQALPDMAQMTHPEITEGDDTIGFTEGRGYYITSTDVQINAAIPIPAQDTYSYPGYVFLGWGRVDVEQTGDGEQTDPNGQVNPLRGPSGISNPADLTDENLFLKWVEDDANTHAGHYVAKDPNAKGEDVWVPVTAVAADEDNPYQDLYAVWAAEFYVYHTGVAGGAVETVLLTRANSTYDLTQHLGGAGLNRDGETPNVLYGGYYLADGVSIPDAVVAEDETEAKIPAYDGTNWTFTKDKAQTVSGFEMHPVAGQTYYIKEVPADKYLQPYFHYTYNKGTGEIHTGWLISAIDDETYQQTGFMVTANGQARVCQSLTVEARDSSYNIKLTAKRVFGRAGLLTYRRVINHYVGEEDVGFANDVKIQQYWVTPDGIIVTGTGYRKYTGIEKTDTVQGETKFEASTLTDSAKTEFESLEQQPKDEN